MSNAVTASVRRPTAPPPSAKKIDFAEVQSRALAIRQRYEESNRHEFHNFLVYGHEGTGKTRLLTTARKPVLLASFDPGGSTTRDLQPFIKSGDIIVQDYSGDVRSKPTKFREWEKDFLEMEGNGFFEHIGTYALDSLTRWADAMMSELVRMNGFKNEGIPDKREYYIQQLSSVDYIGRLCALPCDVFCTGHIALEKDEVEGRMYTGLLLAGKMSDKIPLCFDEKYITRTEGTSKGVRYFLQTHNDGQYRAETRMGGSAFETKEEPDLAQLFRKAGVEMKHKPGLFS